MSDESDQPSVRPVLPDDPEGRSWVQGKTKTKFAPEQSVIPLLVAAVDDKVEILGDCFVIYGHNNSALCLGAAHSFEPVAREQKKRKGQPALNVPADFAPTGPKFIDAGGVQAYIFVETGVVECRVNQLCYIDNYDVALFTIEAPKEYIFTGRIGIDLSVPAVGEVVSVLGNFSTYQERDDKNGTGSFLRRFEARTGLVTEANLGPNRQRQVMSFETTIPFPSGLSGAPVLRGGMDAGKELAACGCVSFDLSPDEAHTKFS